MSIVGWLPPFWQKAIVPLAVEEKKDYYQPVGTGFLLDYKAFNCLLTAKHVVLEKNGQQKTGLFILINNKSGGISATSMDWLTEQGITWIPHHKQDLAATICPLDPKTQDVKRFTFQGSEEFANIREGDDIFFLGFPLGITTKLKITPLVRGGMVSLRAEDDTFLIDANVFPGNSGSPVFFKPCPFELGPSGGLTLGKIRQPKLIGVITGFIAYREVAVSQQTGRRRITFEENSGLATVLSMKFIKETLSSSIFENMVKKIMPNNEP